MKYAQAAKYFPKAIEAMLELDSKEKVTREKALGKWNKIDLEIQREFMSNPEAMTQIALMADGFMMSLTETVEKINSLPQDDDTYKSASILYLKLITSAIVRSFAIGVHCQREVSEVELLNSLVEK